MLKQKESYLTERMRYVDLPRTQKICVMNKRETLNREAYMVQRSWYADLVDASEHTSRSKVSVFHQCFDYPIFLLCL